MASPATPAWPDRSGQPLLPDPLSSRSHRQRSCPRSWHMVVSRRRWNIGWLGLSFFPHVVVIVGPCFELPRIENVLRFHVALNPVYRVFQQRRVDDGSQECFVLLNGGHFFPLISFPSIEAILRSSRYSARLACTQMLHAPRRALRRFPAGRYLSFPMPTDRQSASSKCSRTDQPYDSARTRSGREVRRRSCCCPALLKRAVDQGVRFGKLCAVHLRKQGDAEMFFHDADLDIVLGAAGLK